MSRELPANTSWTVSIGVEIVDGTNVIEAATGDIVSARGVCASHDP